jgi:hypothetical protein
MCCKEYNDRTMQGDSCVEALFAAYVSSDREQAMTKNSKMKCHYAQIVMLCTHWYVFLKLYSFA